MSNKTYYWENTNRAALFINSKKRLNVLKTAVLMLFGGFRGFRKIHLSFPFFHGLFQFKIEIYQTFPGFIGVFRRKGECYKGTKLKIWWPLFWVILENKCGKFEYKIKSFLGNFRRVRSRVNRDLTPVPIGKGLRYIDWGK